MSPRAQPRLSRPARWTAASDFALGVRVFNGVAASPAGFPAGRNSTISRVYDWEQIRESMVLTLPHPTLGNLHVPGSTLRLSEPTEPRREAPPALGVDQDDVFAAFVRARGGR